LISMNSKIWYFLYVWVFIYVRTLVNMLFVMLLLVCIHTEQAEKFACPRLESSFPCVDAHSE
jgi:hypothetical protein